MCFKKLYKWSEKSIKKINSVWDMAIFKLCMASFGVIVGAYISGFVKQYIAIFAALFIVTYAWLLYKIFKK